MLVGFDIETAGTAEAGGLRPQLPGGRITSCAWYEPALRDIIEYQPPVEAIEAQLRIERHYGNDIITWNGVFDVAWLIAKGVSFDLISSLKWHDAMLLYKRYDKMRTAYAKEENLKGVALDVKGYGLKAAVEHFLPEHAGYNDGVHFDIPEGTPQGHPDVQRLLEYNLKDAQYTQVIGSWLLDQLREHQPLSYQTAMLDAEVLPMVAQSWVTGQPIDVARLQAVARETKSETTRLAAEIGQPETVLDSDKQRGKLLFETWGLTPVRETDNGKPSSDKYTLMLLARDDERVRKLFEYRKLKNRWNKFIVGSEKTIRCNRMRKSLATPRLAGTYTGRWTYSSTTEYRGPKGKRKLHTGVAWHQIERGPVIRSLYKPLRDCLLVEFDASQQEVRLMADYSEDPTMVSVFQRGMDIHSNTGASIARMEYHAFQVAVKAGDKQAKHYRNLGKFVNLAIQYRAGLDALMEQATKNYGLFLSKEEVKQHKDTYLQTYPMVKQWWHRAPQLARGAGGALTRGGRMVALTQWLGRDSYKSEQTAINFPIQGTGADIATLALATLKPFLTRHKIRFAWNLHDGQYFHFALPLSEARPVAQEMLTMLSNLDYGVWEWQPKVPLPWDGKIGTSWAEMEAV